MQISWSAGLALGIVCLAAADASACPVANPEDRTRVELHTVLGDICLEMLDGPGEAPGTVANFLGYVARGDYDQSFIHRSVPGFIIQGGGYTWTEFDGYDTLLTDPPILNEPGISNQRGTLAMAKISGDPDSATSQWFINLADNAAILDAQNGGFTVFARVVEEDMPVVDAIEALHIESGQYAVDYDLAPNFNHIPVLEVLERDPDGYGCLIIFPDPLPNGPPPAYGARFESTCQTNEELQAAVDETIVAMDPQMPERLVLIDQAVPEPGMWLQLLLGGLVLTGSARGGRRA